MKKHYLLIFAVVFTSCSNEINLNQLTGTWIESESSDLYESDQIHELSFLENGTYQNRVYDLKDSLVDKFDGTYEIDKETNTIKMTNVGYVLKDMSLTKLTETDLTAEITEYMEGTAELNFKKK